VSTTWIHTRSGTRFDLLAPTTDMVVRADIEHALARINRFSGHTAEPYSVATHSRLVADILELWGCPPAIVREGLLHDAPEAYYGDTVSPVAAAMRAASNGAVTALPDVLRARQEGECTAARDAAWYALTRPLHDLHERIDRVVRAALALPEIEAGIVKRADLVALAIERRDLFGQPEHDWQLPEYADTRLRVREEYSDAHNRFAERWRELDEACGVSR
jgi:5'-deoxynucleotidase YfbR-like HD superfamily hydrolase